MYSEDYGFYEDIDQINGDIIAKTLIKAHLQRVIEKEPNVENRKKIRKLLKDVNEDIRLAKQELAYLGY